MRVKILLIKSMIRYGMGLADVTKLCTWRGQSAVKGAKRFRVLCENRRPLTADRAQPLTDAAMGAFRPIAAYKEKAVILVA